MDSCDCRGIEAKFDQKYVAGKLKQYRKKGPRKTTLQLIDALRAQGFEDLTLLDIGGGVGDIQHAMLRSGLRHATDCEAALPYIEACRQEAHRLGHAEKITHIHGNFVDVAPDVSPAHIVTLDRVVCCYRDMPALINASAPKATRFYGIVYPIDKWWTRLGVELYYNVRHWLMRNPMRMFVHPSAAVDSLIRANGLHQRFYRLMGAWQVSVYART